MDRFGDAFTFLILVWTCPFHKDIKFCHLGQSNVPRNTTNLWLLGICNFSVFLQQRIDRCWHCCYFFIHFLIPHLLTECSLNFWHFIPLIWAHLVHYLFRYCCFDFVKCFWFNFTLVFSMLIFIFSANLLSIIRWFYFISFTIILAIQTFYPFFIYPMKIINDCN